MFRKQRVLFVCTANAARSQMAEALLKKLRPDAYEVFSAGTQPAEIDSRALRALTQMDIDTTGLHSKALDTFVSERFDYVIALCDKAHAECRSLPDTGQFIAWDFDDPQQRNTQAAFAKTLREIQQRIQMFLLVTEKEEVSPEVPATPIDVYKSLADETRVRMVLLIERETELCVCELTCAMDESQPKISRHLALLRTCGLLADRRQGQWVYYRLHPHLPTWVREVLKITGDANREWLAQQIRRLDAMGDRPTRTAACC